MSYRWLFMPSYWLMNEKFSREWDKKLNELLDKHSFREMYYSNGELDKHEVKLGGFTLWVRNHPYASFLFKFGGISVRPSRSTLMRAREKLEKEIPFIGGGSVNRRTEEAVRQRIEQIEGSPIGEPFELH